jgi:hypothetical protein
MRLAKCIRQRQAEISFNFYKQFLILFIGFAFLLIGCSPVQSNNIIDITRIGDDPQVRIGGNTPRAGEVYPQEFDYSTLGNIISNFFSSPEIKKIANPIKPYIDELAIYIPQIESAGIILEDIYTDLNPVSPLLILEFKLEKINEAELNSIVSKSIETKQKLSAGLKHLRTAVQASKSKIGQYGIDRIQIRMGPYPPYASTRLQYSRG